MKLLFMNILYFKESLKYTMVKSFIMAEIVEILQYLYTILLLKGVFCLP